MRTGQHTELIHWAFARVDANCYGRTGGSSNFSMERDSKKDEQTIILVFEFRRLITQVQSREIPC